MSTIAYFDHPTSRWFFAFDHKGLQSVSAKPIAGAQPAAKCGTIAMHHATMLAGMLDGEVERYTLPINITGTPLQLKTWQEIAEISHGETLSYTELAKRAGNPKAVRAAASACGANPVPIAVPCHRVVRSDGSLGGFAFGLELKQRMLDFETNRLRKKAA